MTVSSDVDDRDLVESTLLSVAEEVAARLRRKGVPGRTVTLRLRRRRTKRRALASIGRSLTIAICKSGRYPWTRSGLSPGQLATPSADLPSLAEFLTS